MCFSAAEKLLVIDGSNLLFQMFFGMPARIINQDGKAIQGVLGFTGALIKIIKMTAPTHLIVVFDGEHEQKRTGLLAGYKANRIEYASVPDEKNPFSQLEAVYRALNFLGVKYIETIEFEADDIISSYAARSNQNLKVIISSFDSDFFQLVNDNVTVLRYHGSKSYFCDTAYICNKFGVSPARYADFKALTGDTSDNIKGAEKIGPKTAAALIDQFGSLSDVIENAGKITRKPIQDSILRNAERLYRNYALIELDGKAPIPFDINSLAYQASGISTNEVLKGIHLR